MRRISEKTMEVSFIKRIVAIVMMVSYISVMSPLPLFAESATNDTEAKRTVSVKEEKSEVLISAEEGGIVTLGDASIEIPEGALKKDTKISITRLLKVEDTGESLYNAIPHSGGYRFLPAGTKFEKDVTITLPYSSQLNAKPQSLDELYTYFYDTQKKSWIKLERLEVDRENHKVRSLSTHFTDMINATLTMPESASPVDVNLNSIKNLEAAKPDSHLIKFNPPKASNMGDASFSFELAVPAGRKGMQPQISVSYSSGGGNGIMGKGFDMSYGSSITTDTRFGLPNYDSHDSYMLDGILLEEKTRKGDEITYRPLKETSFSRIKRFMSDNHWEVTDKNGTKRIYANTSESCTGSGNEVFTWNLTKIEDVNNNTVVFEYNNFAEIQGKNTYNYVYPTAIYYTGYKNEKGNYNIKFHYDNDGAESRQDVRIDARSRQIVACKKLLTGITTHYGSDTAAIRTYAFTYKEGLAKEKMLTTLTVSNNADDYSYTFEYNEPEYENGKVKYFANAEVWHNGTAIKTGKSTSGGGSFNTSTGVGVGELSGTADARLTGGVQGSYTNSQSETESMLADIDGDGSPDYIRVKGGVLYYKLNNKTGFSEEEKSVSLEKFKLDAEESKNLSFGWNIYGGGGLKKSFVSGLGVTYSDVSQTTTSNSTVALNDVDGDRKTDIILSGKNYYLKNTSKNGNVSFIQELYDSKNSIVVEDNIKKLTAEEVKAYKEQYKNQTPFRQWKSQYDGMVSITQDFSAAGSFDLANSVKAHVYKGNLETSVSSMESIVLGTKFSEKLNASLSVIKDENLYFITETDEPLNSDVNYNIRIDYTDIKSYKTPLKVPVFFPEQRIANQILPEALKSIYNTTTENKTDENGNMADYTVYVLKESWQELADKETYSQLISQGRFLPGAFTDEQFDKILESFSSKTSAIINKRFFEDDSNEEITKKEIYERFAACFIHDLTNKIYIIRDNNNIKLFDLLYNTLGQKEVLIEAWNNYRLFDIDAGYDKNGIIYEHKSEVTSVGARRGSDITGTQIQNGDVLILADYDGKLLSVSKKNSKVFFDGVEQIDYAVQFENKDGENEDEKIFIVTLTHTLDNEKLIYEFTNYKQKAVNITKAELQSIVDEYSIDYESINDSYWNWNEKLEDDAYECLETFGMSENQQKRFLELVYEKNVKEIIEEEEKKQITVYTKKQNLVGQNLIDASCILSDVKFNTIIKNEFPYYEKSDNDEYNIKKEYEGDITEDSDNTRKEAENIIIEKCNNHGFGKYCSVQVFVQFDENGLYKLDNNSKFTSRRIVSGAISITEEKYSPGQVSWDSSSAWNGITHSDEKVLYEETNEDEDVVIQVERQEKLFAGNSNWFFGIWINGKTAFNGKNIESIFATKDHTKYDYNKEKLKEMDAEAAVSKKGTNEEQPFYLPVFNTVVSDSEIYPVKKEYATNKNDVENSLIGQVSMSSQREEDEEGNYIMVTQYYFPFIQGDYIHASRIGGNTFYNIEGIKCSDSKSSSFVFPNVRMARNEGNDRTFGANAELAIPNTSVLEKAGELIDKLEEIKQKNLGGISGNTGTNTSNGKLTQTVMDINGDSIPDIIQETGSGIKVIPGLKSEDGIAYGSSYTISGVKINTTSSTTETKGASISPNGSVTTTLSRNGKVINVTPSPSVSGGAGMTFSEGSSYVDTGFIDINGDGLPDYFNGSSVYLNKGEEFSSSDLVTVNSGCMNESSLKSSAVNVNVGKSSTRGESLSTGVNLGTGLSYSVSSNTSEAMYLDINGDGLSDKLIQKDGSIAVFYNTGNSFEKADDILLPSWGVNDTEETSLKTAEDVNFDLGLFGDQPIIGPLTEGLVNGLPVCNPFAINDIDNMEFSSTVSLSLNGSIGVSFTFPIKIPIAGISINMTCSGGNGLSGSSSINCVNVSMTDLDGDSLVDHVLRIPGYCTYWKRNISGLYGKLTKVNLPQGGNVEIDYAEQFGTPDNPNFKYVMSRVTMNDGTDKDDVLPELKHGAHSLTTTYEYSDGYYDRNKKDFYGFGTVKTTFAYGNCQEDVYFNREYYSKGCINSITVKTADGAILSESTTTLQKAPYPLPKKEESRTYEKSSGTGCYIATATSYKYDLRYGNCIKITQDFGDGQKLSTDITYDNTNTTDYIVGLPVDIRVYDSNGNLLRHRSGDYDDLGQLKELRQYFDAYNYSVHTLKYDSYGNISSVTDSRGATVAYSYDGTENMFVTDIAQSGTDTDTYKGSIKYDIPTQTKRYEEDCSGNTINYDYDDWQRIVEIRTDYDGKEKSKTPAVSYEYHTPVRDDNRSQDLWYAVTNNKVTFDEDDGSVIQTVVQIDGLGRAVRTAKTGFVNGVEGWNASGAVEYDEKGRIVKEGMTEFIKGGLENLFNTTPIMTELFTSYEYDEKDRQIKTILPDGSAQTNAFYIEENKLISETTDPLGNISVQETDSRGNIVCVAKEDKNGKQLTQVTYKYNEMGEMLKAFDAKGHPITAEYDLLGRRTALESLDSGRQEFFYDECSNLVRENNSVLRENNKQIVYEYDGLNRLIRIDYPDTEDTIYTYGGATDTHGAAGKILSVTDASGTLEYEYGRLGEVTKETRTINTHLNGINDTESAVMEYRSDYLGRMQWITYPDGEKITYGYDKGGQVVSVTGENFGNIFEYVKAIGYDEYGQRVYIEYGNGVKTEYTYDQKRRWLGTIRTENKWGQSYQNITYSFDAVGNVLGYENNCLDNVTGNYKTSQTYSYDNLYQLIRVEGETTYNPYRSTVPEFVSNYTQDFEFDTDGLGNMTSKVSKESVRPNKKIGDNLNYNFTYVYDENFAHRLVRAGERYYKYDANGNIICEQDGSFESNGTDTAYHKIEQETDDVYSTDYGWGLFKEDKTGSTTSRYRRTYTWNERNQLISSVDANYNTAYVYGQDGQRSNKYTANSETLYFNKMWILHTDSGNNIYGGQTAKNIYLGETRIVTKLNSGTNPTYQEEYYKQYYYHSDHLGSASLISDYKGDEYQRIEYTPYGETWVEKTQNQGLEFLPYKFTAKELDEETGLYYYGARYLDPKYSMWISTDPALGEYIPKAPINEEAKRYNQNLPGMGGVFNHINCNLYHYAGNNPVRYIDPDGRWVQFVIGAVVGAALAGAVAAYDSYQETGSVNWKTVGISAAGGAVSGVIAATGIGLAGQIAINGSIGAAVYISDSVASGKEIDAAGVGEAIGFGMLAGLFGGAGAGNSAVTSQMARMGNRIANAFLNKSGDALKKELGNAFKYYMKNGGGKASVETFKAVLRATLSPIIETTDDTIEKIYNEYMNNLSEQEAQ